MMALIYAIKSAIGKLVVRLGFSIEWIRGIWPAREISCCRPRKCDLHIIINM